MFHKNILCFFNPFPKKPCQCLTFKEVSLTPKDVFSFSSFFLESPLQIHVSVVDSGLLPSSSTVMLPDPYCSMPSEKTEPPSIPASSCHDSSHCCSELPFPATPHFIRAAGLHPNWCHHFWQLHVPSVHYCCAFSQSNLESRLDYFNPALVRSPISSSSYPPTLSGYSLLPSHCLEQVLIEWKTTRSISLFCMRLHWSWRSLWQLWNLLCVRFLANEWCDFIHGSIESLSTPWRREFI